MSQEALDELMEKNKDLAKANGLVQVKPPPSVVSTDASEADFQGKLIKALKDNAWLVHAERPARSGKGWVTPIQGNSGFPDLIAVKPPAILVIENKTKSGRLSPEQEKWVIAFSACGVKVLVARPEDWESILKIIEERNENKTN